MVSTLGLRERLLRLPGAAKLLNSSFATNALALGGGNAAAQAILLAMMPVLARFYTPEAFGLFAIYNALFVMLAVPAHCQYPYVLMLPRYHRQAASLLQFVLLLCVAVALLSLVPLLIFRHALAELMELPELVPLVWLVPLSVILVGWYMAFRFWTMRQEAFADVARNAITRVAVTMVLATIMGYWPPIPSFPEAGLIISQAIGEGFGNGLLAYRIYRRDRQHFTRLRWKRMLAMGRRFRRLAMSLAAGSGIEICYARLPIFAIGIIFGPAVAGIYNIAERFAVLPAQLVANAIGDVFRQRATVLYQQTGRFDRLMRRTLATTAALAAVPYTLGIILAPTLFVWFLGDQWEEAGHYARIFMIGGIISFIIVPIDKATVILQRSGFIFYWHLFRLTLKIFAVAATYYFSLSVYHFLWFMVSIRILLYTIDLIYCYHLSKGGGPLFRTKTKTSVGLHA